MLLTALVTLALLGAPPPLPAPPTLPAGARGRKAPPASETAKLYFLAGDLAKAQEWARRGLKTEAKACVPLNANLAEYAFLARSLDTFTAEQARAFLEFDRRISPQVPGKLTQKAIDLYVTRPLELARTWALAGNVRGALGHVDKALAVDPTHAAGLALRAELLAVPDGGVWAPRDGGVAAGDAGQPRDGGR